MTKATDKDMGELHGLLTKQMKSALESSDEAKFILGEMIDQGIDLPPIVEAFLEKASSANPSLLTAIAKFLKDNNITCAVEDNEELSDLQKRLKAKKVGKVVTLDNVVHAESEFH